MNINDVLVLGERIELRVDQNDYKSNIQDILDRSTFMVLHPQDARGIPLHLNMDDGVGVIFFRPNGQFMIRSRVQGRARADGVPMLRLVAENGEPEQYQRRKAFRLDYSMPVIMRPISIIGGAKDRYTVSTFDISDGGMMVVMNQSMPVGSVFELQFSLDEYDIEEIQLRASVRRLIPPEEIGDKQWKMGLEYLNCTEAIRRRIFRFICREQAARRARLAL